MRAACRAVPVAPQTVYRARRSSRDFALAWDAAMLVARPHVEDVLSDRALNGVEEPVFYHGEEIARRRRFDSRLLLAHLARLDKVEDRDEVREVAEGFDAALERLRRGEPVDPLADEDGGADEGDPQSWENENLPFVDRVLLYLDSIEKEGAGSGDGGDGGDCDEGDDQGVSGPEVSMEDIALLAEHDDMAALEAIHTPRSEDAWVDDGHAARLAGYRAEAAVSSQDRVTPVTLPDAAEPCAPVAEPLPEEASGEPGAGDDGGADVPVETDVSVETGGGAGTGKRPPAGMAVAAPAPDSAEAAPEAPAVGAARYAWKPIRDGRMGRFHGRY